MQLTEKRNQQEKQVVGISYMEMQATIPAGYMTSGTFPIKRAA
jgi:hypothetical protein